MCLTIRHQFEKFPNTLSWTYFTNSCNKIKSHYNIVKH